MYETVSAFEACRDVAIDASSRLSPLLHDTPHDKPPTFPLFQKITACFIYK